MQSWLDIGAALLKDPSAAGALTHSAGGALSLPGAAKVLSVMVFAGEDGKEVSIAVHPLAGLLRDPRSICKTSKLQPVLREHTTQSKDFLVLDPAALSMAAVSLGAADGRRAILLDAGATSWSQFDGMLGLRWLVETYAARGIVFSDILAWEAKELQAADFFEGMPPAVLAATHLYNVPVESGAGAPHNPLTLLKAFARPGDFVVWKLDIDAEALEEELLVSLLGDEEALALVDVLFFEHHTSLPIMAEYGWGTVERRNHKESIELFAALRRRGIQAHSWP
jgi:hypothetical protein